MEINTGAQKEDVKERVKLIISRVTKIPTSAIAGEKLIRDDLGVDSMQSIETLAILEKELNIIIDPEKAFDVATINDLLNLVETSMNSSRGEGTK